MSKIYEVTRIVHLNSLKRSLNVGMRVELFEDVDIPYAIVSGEKVENFRDFEICKKIGILKELKTEEVKKPEVIKTPKTQTPKIIEKKMKVVKSDTDMMEKIIDIPKSPEQKKEETKEKDGKMKVIREEHVETVRGMKVLSEDNRSVRPIANGLKADTTMNEDSKELSSLLNGEGKVVAKIGKVEDSKKSQSKKPTAKELKEKSMAAKAKAEARKAEILAKRTAAQGKEISDIKEAIE